MMFFQARIKKCQKQLMEYRKERHRLFDKFDELLDVYGCNTCINFNRDCVDTFSERFIKCSGCEHRDELVSVAEDMKLIIHETEDFLENRYAEIVFDEYANKKPVLVEKKSQNECLWVDVFGSIFRNLSKSQRYDLVALIDGDGRYELKKK